MCITLREGYEIEKRSRGLEFFLPLYWSMKIGESCISKDLFSTWYSSLLFSFLRDSIKFNRLFMKPCHRFLLTTLSFRWCGTVCRWYSGVQLYNQQNCQPCLATALSLTNHHCKYAVPTITLHLLMSCSLSD